MSESTPRGTWNFPTRIRFGAGRIAELPGVCKSRGLSNPLLVTDPGLAGLPMVSAVVAANEAAGIATTVFSDIRPNPVAANVEAGVAAYRAGGHGGIIAMGGGSVLDVGKSIALMAGQQRPIWDFEDIAGYWKRADSEAIATVIAIPTTAGTGSEVGRAAVIINEESHTKKIIYHPAMMPSVVISDPELTIGLPPHLTAATGMDALAHCLEALCAPGYHPMAEGIAMEGLRLVHDWLPVAVKEGANLEARGHMLVAASMGATAFQKGLGGIHALSHPVGALYDTHHGLTNAVFTPYVLAYNRSAVEERMTRLAAYLGLAGRSFEAVMDWLLELRKELEIPHTLAELGVEESRLDELAGMAAKDPTAAGNPLPAGKAEFRQMLDSAMAGKI